MAEAGEEWKGKTNYKNNVFFLFLWSLPFMYTINVSVIVFQWALNLTEQFENEYWITCNN